MELNKIEQTAVTESAFWQKLTARGRYIILLSLFSGIVFSMVTYDDDQDEKELSPAQIMQRKQALKADFFRAVEYLRKKDYFIKNKHVACLPDSLVYQGTENFKLNFQFTLNNQTQLLFRSHNGSFIYSQSAYEISGDLADLPVEELTKIIQLGDEAICLLPDEIKV